MSRKGRAQVGEIMKGELGEVSGNEDEEVGEVRKMKGNSGKVSRET